jgi:RNA polymerase sigma-70 factor (ECF subfamily)
MSIRDRIRQAPQSMSSACVASSLPAAAVSVERSCFEAFQTEFDYLCRTLRRLGVPADDLEDEVHEVFLVLSRKWGEYDASRPLRPYLFGIAFRLVAGRKRRARRNAPGSPEELRDVGPQPDEALEAAYARELVLRALDHVPLPRRAVLVMHDIDEVPMRAIAEALSLPLFTGYSRLRKARKEFETAVKLLRQGRLQP